jgi:Leucine-rich repeat (LRR) protein
MKQHFLLLLLVLSSKITLGQDSLFLRLTSGVSLREYKYFPQLNRSSSVIMLYGGVESDWENNAEKAIASIEEGNTFFKDPTLYNKVKKLKKLKYLSYKYSDSRFPTCCYDIDKFIDNLPFPDSIKYLEYDFTGDNNLFPNGIEKLTGLCAFSLIDYSWPTRKEGFTLKNYRVQQSINYLMVKTHSYIFIDANLYDFTNIDDLRILSDSIDSIPNGISKLTNLRDLCLYTSQLKSLPEDIGNLNKLISLHMTCSNLTQFPMSFSMLDSLKHLGMESCLSMKNFPYQIFNLKNLESISCDKTLIELLNQTSSSFKNNNVRTVSIWPHFDDLTNHYKKSNFIKRVKYKKIIRKHFPNAKTIFV